MQAPEATIAHQQRVIPATQFQAQARNQRFQIIRHVRLVLDRPE